VAGPYVDRIPGNSARYALPIMEFAGSAATCAGVIPNRSLTLASASSAPASRIAEGEKLFFTKPVAESNMLLAESSVLDSGPVPAEATLVEAAGGV